MKIVTWNCNGALRKKFEQLILLDADIYVIQECEDPEKCINQKYKDWASNYLWIGNNKNSGLGVFAKREIKIEPLNWDALGLQSFIPFKVNNEFTVLAVWTKQANSPTFQYIGQLWKYLQAHSSKLNLSKSIVCGDLNSNTYWDKWDRWWNHSDVVNDLAQIGIFSIYHHINNIEHGKELIPTFYLYRNLERFYHIDYAFASTKLLTSAKFEIGEFHNWISLSDHMPVIFEID